MKKINYMLVITIIILFFTSYLYAQQNSHSNSENRPNIIIIVIDSLRADHVGCYGYYRNTTPNIDDFSKDAILFKNAISNASHTTKSIPALITSKYNSRHIYINLPGQNLEGVILNPNYPTLPQLLKKSGYNTCFISDLGAVFYIKGLSNGFDTFVETKSNNPGLVTKTALEWIASHKEKPFFILTHYYGPHHPYQPNKAASLRVPLKQKDIIVPLAEEFTQILGFIAYRAKEAGKNNLNYYINNYDGKILLTDEQLGFYLDEIKKTGLYDNSIVVITADHGEEFGEHNLYCSHGFFLFNTLLHVPLLIKMPFEVSKGKSVDETVSLLDVVPSIIDILGINRPVFDGHTLVPLITSRETDKQGKELVFSNLADAVSVIADKWKLIHNSKKVKIEDPASVKDKKPWNDYELYNFKNDPYEQDNLFSNFSQVDENIFDELKAALTEYEAEINYEIKFKLLPYLKETTDNNPDKRPGEDIEKLKSLGYVQ